MWTMCLLSAITATHIRLYNISTIVTVCNYNCEYVREPLKVYIPYGEYCMEKFYRKK